MLSKDRLKQTSGEKLTMSVGRSFHTFITRCVNFRTFQVLKNENSNFRTFEDFSGPVGTLYNTLYSYSWYANYNEIN